MGPNKHITILIRIVFALCGGLVTSALAASHDLSGIWIDPVQKEPAAIILEQIGRQLIVVGSHRDIQDRQVIWRATGKIHHNQVIIDYKFSKHFPEYGRGKIVFQMQKGQDDLLIGNQTETTSHFIKDKIRWIRKR